MLDSTELLKLGKNMQACHAQFWMRRTQLSEWHIIHHNHALVFIYCQESTGKPINSYLKDSPLHLPHHLQVCHLNFNRNLHTPNCFNGTIEFYLLELLSTCLGKSWNLGPKSVCNGLAIHNMKRRIRRSRAIQLRGYRQYKGRLITTACKSDGKYICTDNWKSTHLPEHLWPTPEIVLKTKIVA